MAQRSNSFEGGSGNNTVLLTAGAGGNSGGASGDYFDVVGNSTGTALCFSTDHPAHGSFGLRVAPAAATPTYVDWTTQIGTLPSPNFGRFYLYVPAYPGAADGLVQPFSGTHNWYLALNTDGTLQIRDSTFSATTWASGAVAIGTNNMVRIEWEEVQSASVGQVVVRLYTTADSSTIAETIDSGATRNVLATSELRFGYGANAVAYTTYFDDIVAGAPNWPGPVPAMSPPNFRAIPFQAQGRNL